MGDMGQAFNMLFVMMAIVFLILILLIIIIELMGIVIGFFTGNGKGSSGSSGGSGSSDPAPKNQANLMVPVSGPAPVVEGGIPDEVVAVIAGAIAAMDGANGTHSVIRSVARAKGQRSPWSMAGVLKNTNPFSL